MLPTLLISSSWAFQTTPFSPSSFISSHQVGYSHVQNKNGHSSLKAKIFFPATTQTALKMWNSDEINGPDKIKACIPYLLPLIDGDMYGKFIYQRVPPLKFLDDLFIAPLVDIFEAYPFFPLIFFVLLVLGTRNADGMSRVVRFNAQQAVLIDITLILPTLIGEGLDGVGVPRSYQEFGSNFVFYALMTAIIYSVATNLTGRKPNGIPYVSDAAEYLTGPF